MNRIQEIKARWERYTNPTADTDKKLEDGAIMDWVNYADDDVAFLLTEVTRLREALAKYADPSNWCLDNETSRIYFTWIGEGEPSVVAQAALKESEAE